MRGVERTRRDRIVGAGRTGASRPVRAWGSRTQKRCSKEMSGSTRLTCPISSSPTRVRMRRLSAARLDRTNATRSCVAGRGRHRDDGRHRFAGTPEAFGRISRCADRGGERLGRCRSEAHPSPCPPSTPACRTSFNSAASTRRPSFAAAATRRLAVAASFVAARERGRVARGAVHRRTRVRCGPTSAGVPPCGRLLVALVTMIGEADVAGRRADGRSSGRAETSHQTGRRHDPEARLSVGRGARETVRLIDAAGALVGRHLRVRAERTRAIDLAVGRQVRRDDLASAPCPARATARAGSAHRRCSVPRRRRSAPSPARRTTAPPRPPAADPSSRRASRGSSPTIAAPRSDRPTRDRRAACRRAPRTT